MFVMMPDELTGEFAELDHLAVELGCDVRFPGFLNMCKLFGNIYFFHAFPLGKRVQLSKSQTQWYRCTIRRLASTERRPRQTPDRREWHAGYFFGTSRSPPAVHNICSAADNELYG